MPVNASGKKTSRTFLRAPVVAQRHRLAVLVLQREIGRLGSGVEHRQRRPAALDFGCTSRLALQSPRLADDVCISPAVGADSAISAGMHVPRLARLGGQHPDDAVIGQRGDGVHQSVDQVAVAVAPPQQHDVDDLVRVLIEQFATTGVLDVGPDVVVGVLVPTQLLDNLLFFDAQPSGVVRGAVRRDHRCTSFSQSARCRSAANRRTPSVSRPWRADCNRRRRRVQRGGLLSFSRSTAALN